MMEMLGTCKCGPAQLGDRISLTDEGHARARHRQCVCHCLTAARERPDRSPYARVPRIEVCHCLPGCRNWIGPSRGRKIAIDCARGIRASSAGTSQRRGEGAADASTACSHAAKRLLDVVRTGSSFLIIPRASKQWHTSIRGTRAPAGSCFCKGFLVILLSDTH